MKKHQLFFLIFLLVLSCKEKRTNLKGKENDLTLEDSLVIERLNWVYQLKKLTASEYWTDFNTGDFNGSLIYKSIKKSYIIEPNNNALKLPHKKISYDKGTLIKVDSLIGGDGYEMQVLAKSGDIYKNDISYEFPIVISSNVEKTKLSVPDVPSTEMWSTMLVHELIHNFQRKLGWNGKENEIRHLLKKHFVETPGFRKSVIAENEMVMKMLNMKEIEYQHIKDYLKTRKARLIKMPENIKNCEVVLEKIEGSGRYIEAKAMLTVEKVPVHKNLAKIDSLYKQGKDFYNFDIKTQGYLTYAGGKSSYFYATGYNLLLLLDKLDINYKNNVFKDFKKPLFEYLEDYINEKNR